jgi:tRNA A-37 threonylcarbamoyl transferase component Bud32
VTEVYRYQGLRWRIQSDFIPLLPEVLAANGETVKQTDLTRVSRHQVAGRTFYVKRYRFETRALAPVVYAIRCPKSRREWRYAARLQQRGVAVVPHCAHGERWGWRGLMESVVITEGLDGFVPMKGRHDLGSPAFDRELGRFLRQMHDAGVIYLDLAPQNLMYAPTQNAFCLIDVDKVSLRDRQSEQARIDNLIFLACRWPLTPGFYEGYGREYERYAEEIAERAQTERELIFRRLSRRWRQHEHDLIAVQAGDLCWLVRRAYDIDSLKGILADPDSYCDGSGKRFLVQRFGFAKGRRAYREAYRLELLGRAQTRPVAVGEKRAWGICWRSYFIGSAG